VLRACGFKTRSRNFANTVRVMLRREDGRSTGKALVPQTKSRQTKAAEHFPRSDVPP
jgi:hypothetical protein